MRIRSTVFVLVWMCALPTPGFAQDFSIAGVSPEKRPENAPVITKMSKDAAWYSRALTGVVSPYPSSLEFLEDQGNWFSPFRRPGMTGPYDLRGWHDVR